MEQKTPGWIRLEERREIKHYTNPTYWALREWYDYTTREGEQSESFNETYYPNLASIIRFCLEANIGDAMDLADTRRLLIVKTAELMAAIERIAPEVQASKPKVQKRQAAA